MMFVSPLRSNYGTCPLWGLQITVTGIYGERADGTWGFLRAECPIIKNSKLPLWKQEPCYKLMFCKDEFSCPLYTQFQPSITSDK